MLDLALRALNTFLDSADYYSDQAIEDAIDDLLRTSKFASCKSERETLLKMARSHFRRHYDDEFHILLGRTRREPWLASRKTSIQWNFWNRYKLYLEDEKGFPPEILNNLDKLTDKTLDSLFDPERSNVVISKKGLVVGQVQSGKTSNYTGVICKAADAGFRFIIVLTGIHDNLRSQTQLRIDEGFLGFDTQYLRALDRSKTPIGVGDKGGHVIAHSLTSSEGKGDFSSKIANSLGINFLTTEPIIAVVKKNGSVLKHLRSWLASKAIDTPTGKKIHSKSLLLIDDEADNASINTRKEEEDPTVINRRIRDILGLFNQSAYIGYTATPFANIFISKDEDDLFPRDFIIGLPVPDNYIGPSRVFGLKPQDEDALPMDVLPIVQCIRDYEGFVPSRRGDPLPKQIPDSLLLAIRCFIITCAIRRLRGHTNAHNSMLIHISRFIQWQGHIKEHVETAFFDYRNKISIEMPETMEEFRRTFEEDNGEYLSYTTTSRQILASPPLRALDARTALHEWTDVRAELNEAAQRIRVLEINGGSADALNYFDNEKDGLSVIAIGGDKLSRGLTLEGLSVSYYLRSARNYDTLMQMGRWFGYRPGYVDLCRLFTNQELNTWFSHIAYASEELRTEFNYMADVAHSTPDMFALRVRSHPGQLQITAANKRRLAVEVEVSWAGRMVESYLLPKKRDIIEANFAALKVLIENLDGVRAVPRKEGCYLWRNVAAEHIQDFLRDFQLPDSLLTARPEFLERYIDDRVKGGEMRRWNVALMSKKGPPAPAPTTILKNGEPLDVGQYVRREDEDRSDELQFAIKKSRLISKTDEFIDASDEEMVKIRKRTEEVWLEKENKKVDEKPPAEDPLIYRHEFRDKDSPLLLLYLIDPLESTKQPEPPKINFPLPPGTPPLAAFAIAFPGRGSGRAVRYAIARDFLDNYISTDIPDDDENDD